MKTQSGDADNWQRTVRQIAEIDRAEAYTAKLRRRSTDAKTQAEFKRRHENKLAERMLIKILIGSAIFSIGLALSFLFFATGGDFNLIEWVRELL